MMWIKALEKPTASENEEVLRQKYNDILEETLVSRKNSHIIDIKDVVKKALFDRSGHLTAEGKIKLWREIDEMIQKFDQYEIDLKPQPVVSNSRSCRFTRKLPTSPPKVKSAVSSLSLGNTEDDHD